MLVVVVVVAGCAGCVQAFRHAAAATAGQVSAHGEAAAGSEHKVVS